MKGGGQTFGAKIPKFLHIFSLMGGFDEWMNDPLRRAYFFFTHFYGKRGNFSRGKRVNQGKRFPTAHLHPVTWSFTRVLWECSDSFQTIFFSGGGGGKKNYRSKGWKIWNNFGGKFLFKFCDWGLWLDDAKNNICVAFFRRISIIFILIDSSFNVLQLWFWVQSHAGKHLGLI